MWDGTTRLVVLTGAFHARLDDSETMAASLAQRLPGLRPAMVTYQSGRGWSRGPYDLSEPMPDAPITVQVKVGSPAVVPGHPSH